MRPERVSRVLRQPVVTNLRPARVPRFGHPHVYMPRTATASPDGTEASGSKCDTRRLAHFAAGEPRKHRALGANRSRACRSTVELRWEWLPETDEQRYSENLFGLFGLEPGSIIPTREWMLERTHPDDRERVARFVELTRAWANPAPIAALVWLRINQPPRSHA
jgi:hypothetical protein